MAGKFSVQGIFKMNDAMSGPIAKIENRFERMQRRVGAGMSNLGGGIGKAWNATGKWASGVSERAKPLAALGGDLKQVGVAAAAAGAAAGAGLVAVMRTGMDFEKTLLDAGNKFEPGINKASESFKRLSAAAQEVGGSTEFSASQSAMALNDLAGAGFNVEQAISALPKVVNFATAASLDLSAASEVAAKSLGAFGMKSDDPKVLAANLQKVTDSLMKADALSSTDIPALFEVIKEGGPIAAQAGVSLESFMAMAASLGEAGIEGSVGGTTLKNTIMTLAKATPEAEAALKRLGVATKTASGQLRDPIDTLADLKKATDKMQGAERIGILEQIFGKIPLAGVSAMLGDVDKLAKNKTGIVGAAGQVDVVAASKRQSTQGSWDNLTSAVEGVGLGVFDAVGDDAKGGMDEISKSITALKGEALPFIKEFVGGLKEGFKEAWPAIQGALDLLFDGFGGKADWLTTAKEFATTLGKVAAGAIGVATVIGGMLLAGLQIVGALVGELIDLWNGLIDGIGAALFAVGDFFANIAAKWEAFSFADWGKRMMQGLVEGIKNGAKWVMDALQGLADKMINKLKSALMIHSPSRRTKPIGKFSAMGLGDGWEDQMPKVDRQIQRSIDVSAMVHPKLAPPMAVSPVLASPYLSKWEMPAINALPLGSDHPAPAGPQVAAPGGAAGGRAAHDELEITVRSADGAAAEVTKKPKSRLITLKTPRSGDA